jgi:hypothetical protein
MKPFVFLCACVGLAAFATVHADPRPLVLEDAARITSPDSRYSDFGGQVAIDGNWAIATGRRVVDDEPGAPPTTMQAAFLFRHVGTSWAFVRLLQESRVDREFQIDAAVAMENGIAAVQTGPLVIYEFNGTDWIAAPSTLTRDGPGIDIEIDAGRIIVGDGTCSWNAYVYAKDTTGTWVTDGTLNGGYKGCDDEFRGGAVDIGGDWAVVFQPGQEDIPGRTAYIYKRYPDDWYELAYGEARLDDMGAVFGSEVATANGEVFVSGANEKGTYVFRETPAYGFHIREQIQPVDSFMGGGHAFALERHGEFVGQLSTSFDRGTSVINLFARRNGPFTHVATLQARNGARLGYFAMSGRRVLVAGDDVVYSFELPSNLTTPAPFSDDFENGGAARWTVTTPASAFTVATSGNTRVLRQSSTSGEARAVAVSTDWRQQAIEADVRVTAFNGADRWVGLVTRYQNADHYYLATLRNSGSVRFQRVIAGVARTLASAPLAVSAGRNYHLRLESIGTQHRVFVDGRLVLDVDSTGMTHGSPGVFTSYASADIDNVYVSPSPRATIYSTDFEAGSAGPWTTTGVGFWNLWQGESTVFYQSSVGGDARAAIGAPTDAISVRLRARLDTFATATGSQERWLGVFTRYTDASNYYYLSLRSSNTLQIRKLVNGTITTLASVPLTVTPFEWYQLRLDAVGTKLRGYVNGRLLVEATDSSHARGVSGPVTYKAAADFDDYLSYQP